MGTPLDNHATVYYQYMIMIDGKAVGTIQRFNPSTERDLERIREIMNNSDDTVEIAVGRSDTQITTERVELNKQAMMNILAPGDDFVDISQLNVPVNIVEVLRYPDGTKRTIVYQDCEAKSYSKTTSVDTITVTESVTFWVRKVGKG